MLRPPDEWEELAAIWNPFAQKLNQGVLDAKLWKRVVDAVNRIDGRRCK